MIWIINEKSKLIIKWIDIKLYLKIPLDNKNFCFILIVKNWMGCGNSS